MGVAERLPRMRMFSMGNGRIARVEQTSAFCDGLVDGCLDADVCGFYDFTLGFAACLDAIARGTLDLDADPIETIIQAREDLKNFSTTRNKITDIMRFGDE